MTVAALSDRFWSKVDKCGPVPAHCPELGACWVWTASCDRKGYGQIFTGERTATGNKKPAAAHRVSWLLHHADPGGLCVLHRCDNPACVRPEHLFLGTVADNNRDMWAKGRATKVRAFGDASGSRKHPERLARGDRHYSRREPERLARGERHGKTRLTADQVREIRRERESGTPLKALADRFGISACAVSAIAHRRNWGHVQ